MRVSDPWAKKSVRLRMKCWYIRAHTPGPQGISERLPVVFVQRAGRGFVTHPNDRFRGTPRMAVHRGTMARTNCDPYAGFHLFALVNRVTALLDSEEAVQATVQALEADGVAPGDIDIFTGEEGAKCLDLPGREHGRAIHLLRALEATMGDERETNRRIDSALRQGATLVCVKIPATLPAVMHAIAHPSSLATFRKDKSDQKARAMRVFQTSRAHDIHYWGAWSFEDMPRS
jgi:hypothetical protein